MGSQQLTHSGIAEQLSVYRRRFKHAIRDQQKTVTQIDADFPAAESGPGIDR